MLVLWIVSNGIEKIDEKTKPTNIARDVGVEAAEDDATLGKALGVGRALLDDHAAHVVWDGASELPSDDASVLLAGGPGGGAQCVDGKVGVGGEELDEAREGGLAGKEERVARGLTAGRQCRLRRGCRP